MSKEHPLMLYVGSDEDGRQLSAAAAERGWHVFLPQDDLEALAMFSVYYPDVSVVDRGAAFADEVEFHLRSIDASLILLGEHAQTPDAGPEAILDAVAGFLANLLPVI